MVKVPRASSSRALSRTLPSPPPREHYWRRAERTTGRRAILRACRDSLLLWADKMRPIISCPNCHAYPCLLPCLPAIMDSSGTNETAVLGGTEAYRIVLNCDFCSSWRLVLRLASDCVHVSVSSQRGSEEPSWPWAPSPFPTVAWLSASQCSCSHTDRAGMSLLHNSLNCKISLRCRFLFPFWQ